MLLVLHHANAGREELLINADFIAAVTNDAPHGARIHTSVTTGLSWGVAESYDEVKALLAEPAPNAYSTPPPPPQVTT